MKTTKPISTISFNSPEYLFDRLTELVKSKKISFFAFIKHQPEDDEGLNKSHSHVYLIPSALIQTDDIKAYLKEYDPTRPDKPRGCIDIKPSKCFGDWYLYGLHEPSYLASKNQSRRFTYEAEDVITSDEDELQCLVAQIDRSSLNPIAAMAVAIRSGVTFDEYVASGNVPIQSINQFSTAWKILVSDVTRRNGRHTHSPR